MVSRGTYALLREHGHHDQKKHGNRGGAVQQGGATARIDVAHTVSPAAHPVHKVTLVRHTGGGWMQKARNPNTVRNADDLKNNEEWRFGEMLDQFVADGLRDESELSGLTPVRAERFKAFIHGGFKDGPVAGFGGVEIAARRVGNVDGTLLYLRPEGSAKKPYAHFAVTNLFVDEDVQGGRFVRSFLQQLKKQVPSLRFVSGYSALGRAAGSAGMSVGESKRGPHLITVEFTPGGKLNIVRRSDTGGHVIRQGDESIGGFDELARHWVSRRPRRESMREHEPGGKGHDQSAHGNRGGSAHQGEPSGRRKLKLANVERTQMTTGVGLDAEIHTEDGEFLGTLGGTIRPMARGKELYIGWLFTNEEIQGGKRVREFFRLLKEEIPDLQEITGWSALARSDQHPSEEYTTRRKDVHEITVTFLSNGKFVVSRVDQEGNVIRQGEGGIKLEDLRLVPFGKKRRKREAMSLPERMRRLHEATGLRPCEAYVIAREMNRRGYPDGDPRSLLRRFSWEASRMMEHGHHDQKSHGKSGGAVEQGVTPMRRPERADIAKLGSSKKSSTVTALGEHPRRAFTQALNKGLATGEFHEQMARDPKDWKEAEYAIKVATKASYDMPAKEQLAVERLANQFGALRAWHMYRKMSKSVREARRATFVKVFDMDPDRFETVFKRRMGWRF